MEAAVRLSHWPPITVNKKGMDTTFNSEKATCFVLDRYIQSLISVLTELKHANSVAYREQNHWPTV